MKTTFNQVILAGFVGTDPSLYLTANQKKIVSFALSTKYSYKKGEEEHVVTDWHQIVCYGNIGEYVLNYIEKGMFLNILGELHYHINTKNERTQKFTSIKLLKVTGCSKVNKVNTEEIQVSKDIKETLEAVEIEEPTIEAELITFDNKTN